MIFELDDKIPFSKRHEGETIRQILRYDSGYLRDLMIRDNRVVFSVSCFSEIMRLTKSHYDNWEKPKNMKISILDKLKTYRSPYLYNFDDGTLEKLNKERLNQLYK